MLDLNYYKSKFKLFTSWKNLESYLDEISGKHYVYLIWDCDKDKPHYVGEGRWYRVLEHHTRDAYTSVTLAKCESIVFIQTTSSKIESLDIEEALILDYGRRIDRTGPLVNIRTRGQISGYRKDLAWFEAESRKVHGDKYEYLDYFGKRNKARLRCKIQGHSEFWQSPRVHLSGSGCPDCGKLKSSLRLTKITTESFIRDCEIIHEGRCSYSKTEYRNKYSLVTVTCEVDKSHGDFQMLPYVHKNKPRGCPKCSANSRINKLRKYYSG